MTVKPTWQGYPLGCFILALFLQPSLVAQETAPQSLKDRSRDEHHYLHKVEKPHAAEWGYTGKTGPAFWGSLSPDYLLAETGTQQSPIDISASSKKNMPQLQFNYAPARIDLVYNGHTVQENEEQGSFVSVGGRRFNLQQFHFHAPSEHTVGGKHSAMEMHLVHKDENGHVAVVGIMIEEGEHNAALDAVWDYLPSQVNKTRKVDVQFNAQSILPSDHSYFHYMGSFTTPPCTEDVDWFVMRKPIRFSKAQIARFTAIINHNNRPVQALNGRAIERSN